MTSPPKELIDSPDSARSATPTDLLANVLARLRLGGAIFLRAEFSAPFAYESPPPEQLIQVLKPDARGLILFHIIAEGHGWIRSRSGDELEVSGGEVIVLPYSDQHVMGSASDVDPVPIVSLLSMPPWDRFPVIEYGGGGEPFQMVCGYLYSDDPIFDPVVRALPSLFSVRPPDGPAAAWVSASIQYALDASEDRRPASPAMALRLPELLFAEVLRLYLESAPPLRSGWLPALRDPVVGPALVELHADPAHKWTVEELARRTATSRSVLAERFSRLLGRPPMQYLADWRLQVAAGLLRDTPLAVAAVAYRVGYESEEAFNRAFKRAMGRPPAQWRRHATAG
jgi:AraC-like DNA-binding protein